MKKNLVIILLTIIGNCSFGQGDFTFNQGQSKSIDYFSIISYENINGKIVLKTEINEKSYRFILDTGAPTTISAHLYNELSPKLISKLPIFDQSGKVDSMVVVSLKEITIGDIVFTDVPTLVADRTLILECLNADGFIGSNVLRNSIVQFNDVNKTVTITNDERRLTLNPKQSSELVLDKRQSSPYFWIKLKNKKKGEEQLLFDSGMDNFYDLSHSHYTIFKKKSIFEIIGTAHGSYSMGLHGAADNANQYKLRLPKMEINGAEFVNVSVKTTTSDNSRIGSKLLEYGLVTIDYKNKKFYFSSLSSVQLDLFEKSLPIDLIYRNEQIQVGIVWNAELGEKVRVGDQVIAVDDISYEGIDICEVITKESRLKDKEIVTLTIKGKTGLVEKILIEKR